MLVRKPVSWTYSALVKRPLSWTWSKMAGDGDGKQISNSPPEDYVISDLAQQMAEAILERHHSNVRNDLTDAVVEYTQLQNLCNDLCPDPTCFHLSLLFLCQQKRCSLLESGGPEKLIKFAPRDQVSTTPPTENDLRIYKLKASQEQLRRDITELNERIEGCRAEAKQFLAKGQKSTAKNCLRQKRRLEQLRSRKESALDNLIHMMNMIEQVDSHKMIYDAYKSGNDAFKDLTHRYGLTPEMVDDVMVNLQEMNETVDDMNMSISQPVEPGEPSLLELEEELEGILADEREAEAIEQEFPTPPRTLPATPPHQELVDAFCKLKVTPPSEMEDLPEVPTFDPSLTPDLASPATRQADSPVRRREPALAEPLF